MHDLAYFNTKRAKLFADALYEHGICHVCIAPGSRSSLLALAVAEHPSIRTFVHFDERSLAFYALGLAKALQAPVALLVTTGTAVANIFPALMEADASRTPILCITCDRPPELRDCGGNQTADHIKIFSSFVRWEVDLAFSDIQTPDAYIVSTISHAIFRTKNPKGAVHLNCMIREPVIHKENPPRLPYTPCIYEPTHLTPSMTSLDEWAKILSSTEKGVILLGSDALSSADLPSFLQLAQALKWPVISDALSGGRMLGNHPYHIEYFEFILRAFPDIQTDTLLQIGNRFVSKTLQQWIQRQENTCYLQVIDHPFRQDPFHKIFRRMECSTSTFCKLLAEKLSDFSLSTWTLFWKEASLQAKKSVHSYFSQEKSSLQEAELFFSFSNKDVSYPIFLGNSMPIRDADLLLYPEDGASLLFCNRGVSGIDGNIATAFGIAEGLQRPLTVFIGDLAALHDISSFAWQDQVTVPVFFHIINNQGGGIFSFLPVAEKKELFEQFIATAHSYNFEHFAKSFSIPYKKVASLSSWEKAFKDFATKSTSCLIECQTTRTENFLDHQLLYDSVVKHLCSFMQPLEALQ